MHCVITGVTGLRNRGVEALVLPIIEGVRAKYPDAKITLATNTPPFDAMRLDVLGIDVIHFAQPGNLQSVRNLMGKIVGGGNNRLKRLHDAIKSSDMLIVTGGDVFSSEYSGLARHLGPVRVAIDNRVPVVLLAHSLGPFKTEKEVATFQEVSRKLSLVTLREKKSYDYSIEVLETDPAKTHLTADVAFLLKPESEEKIDKIRKYYGLEADRPTLALGVSGGITKYLNSKPEAHIDAWKQFVRWATEKYGMQILIVPHVQEVTARNDDRIVATNLVAELEFDPAVKVASMNHDAREYKGLIKSCDMVISERMHACIGGLSTGTPTVSVKYSVKAEGIMQDFFRRRRLK